MAKSNKSFSYTYSPQVKISQKVFFFLGGGLLFLTHTVHVLTAMGGSRISESGVIQSVCLRLWQSRTARAKLKVVAEIVIFSSTS